MCGICGIIGTGEDAGRRQTVGRMLEALAHRGPDGARIWEEKGAALGFARLSIIDLEGGMQPILSETERYVLMCNGEIYNAETLREKLAGRGHRFRTGSDCETVLHGFEEYGADVPKRLRGMFAFAVWDREEQSLFAARDPFGIKPLYYTQIAGELVFASEIKGILAHPGYRRRLNRNALEMYLSFQYSALEESFFRGIYCLLPGHALTWSEGEIKTFRYFDPLPGRESRQGREELARRLEQVLQDSVKVHQVSDVEVGTFLSGGVDSNLLAAMFGGKKAFSVGFCAEGGNYDEMDKAGALAKKFGLEHYMRAISEQEFMEAVPRVVRQLDEPSGDASAVALDFVAQEAAKRVKVVISGEGADELFGGYPIYHEPLDLRYYTWLPAPLRRAVGRMVRRLPYGMKGRGFLIRGSQSVEERFIGNANIFSREEVSHLLKGKSQAASPADFLAEDYQKVKDRRDSEKMQYIDRVHWLPGDILQKADRMSMAHSLELRVPYLDMEVFRLARELPEREKIHAGETKYLFRAVAQRYLPPCCARRKKLGFAVPIRLWMRQEGFGARIEETFRSAQAESFFHTDRLMGLLEEHRAGRRDNSRKIWTVYMFLIWYRLYFGGESETV